MMVDAPPYTHMSNEQLQAIVDEHTVSAVNGRCTRCQEYGCQPRKAALVILATRDVLPVRQRAGGDLA